jgi:nucleoid associated protein NdpA
VPILETGALASLAIERMIFHVVGPTTADLQLLDELVPGVHAEFFLERLRSTAKGTMYDFIPGSSVHAAVSTIQSDAETFVAQSKVLAEQFQFHHHGNASVGGFVVFALTSAVGPLFALVKFDHEPVLSYHIVDENGVRRADIDALTDTFVKSPDALQKSAIIRLTGEGGELSVRDRSGPRQISKYFEKFLMAKRRYTDSDLTEKLADIARAVARDNREELGPEIFRSVSTRIWSATQNLPGFDPLDHAFLNAIFGPVAEDSKIRKDFQRMLKAERIEDEAFNFDRDVVKPPAKKRLTTAEGVQIIYSTANEELVRREPLQDGRTRITIDTGHIDEDDDFTEQRSRAR